MSPSFGCTCAGRARAAAALSLLGLLLAMAGSQPGPATTASAAANPSPALSLGFGPSSLFPVSGGAPVYTTGETIWAESGYNYSVPLSLTSAGPSPGAPSQVVAGRNLDPQVVAPVYTFRAGDAEGVWNITLETVGGQVVVPVRLVNLADHRPLLLGSLQYSLDGGNLSISTQANLQGFYDQEVCAGGSASESPVSVALPRGMGELGSLALTPGNPFGILTLGVLNESVSFWFELSQAYALDVGGTNNLVAQSLTAAASQPVDIVGNGPVTTTLTWNAPLRAGRYDLRAYFQNSTSLEVFQSRVLVLNSSSWVSLSSTCLPREVQSSGVSYSESLSTGPENWPRTLYYMYRASGVEAVVSYPLRANVSSVSFEASPWSKPVQDARVSVTSSTGVLQTSQEGDSLFVLASEYPAEINYSLSIGGAVDLAQLAAAFEGPYSTQAVEVSLAQLTVHLASNQGSPITLEVTGSPGLDIARGPVGSNRTVTLLLPTGSYTVTASQAGRSQSAKVDVTDGAAAAATVSLNPSTALEDILIATAVVAVAANMSVWAYRSRVGR